MGFRYKDVCGILCRQRIVSLLGCSMKQTNIWMKKLEIVPYFYASSILHLEVCANLMHPPRKDFRSTQADSCDILSSTPMAKHTTSGVRIRRVCNYQRAVGWPAAILPPACTHAQILLTELILTVSSRRLPQVCA